MIKFEKYKLPIQIKVSREYNRWIGLNESVKKKIIQIGSHIEIRKGYGNEYNQLEIIDTDGCIISPKRNSEIKEKYLKIWNLWEQGLLERM